MDTGKFLIAIIINANVSVAGCVLGNWKELGFELIWVLAIRYKSISNFNWNDEWIVTL